MRVAHCPGSGGRYHAGVDHSEVRVRRACPEDAGAIAAIYAEAVTRGGATLDREPASSSDFAAACDDPRVQLFSACAGPRGAGCVVGWGRLQPWSHKPGYDHTAEVSIFVAEAAWRQGHARRLLARVIETAERARLRHLVARIFATNLASLALFEGHGGFERVGVQREIGRQAGRWVDIVILQRLLVG